MAGASEITAYNLTLLATFPLVRAPAYWLAYTLTQRRDAAFLKRPGLRVQPVPDRAPRASRAARGVRHTGGARGAAPVSRHPAAVWLVVYAVALAVQALSASYYAMFFSVVLALWMLWFLRWNDRRLAIEIVVASACAVAAVTPIVVGYLRWHARYGLARTFLEVQAYSADLSSFVTASPLMALWGGTWSLNGPERQLFPGLTVLLLVATGVVAAWRRTGNRRSIPQRRGCGSPACRSRSSSWR